MYIIKNAFRCIGRSLGRNILIGIIVLVISVSSCIGLSIRQAAQDTKQDTMDSMSVTATISFDRSSMMSDIGEGGFDKEKFSERIGESQSLSLDEYKKYAEASSVEDFYYTVTTSLDGNDDFLPVSTEVSETKDETASENNFGGNKQSSFPGNFGGGMMGGKQMTNGDFSLIGYSSDSAMTDFIDSTVKMTDGEVFEEGTEKYNCIISKELATYNELKTGKKITLTNPNNEDETYTLKIVGIYEDSSSNEGFERMPGSDPANKIYMSASAVEKIMATSESKSETITDEDSGREYETALTSTLSPTYVFKNTEKYELFKTQAWEMGLSSEYTVSSSDIEQFENSLRPLESLSQMAGWFLLVILAIGAVILVVLNIFNVRERKYEIGVLMAVGMKKINVAKQFLIEAFAVTLVAVVIGVIAGGVCSVPVTNALLESQVEATKNESSQIEDNFGRGEMPNMPSGGGFGGESMTPPDRGDSMKGVEKLFGEKTANYVSEINSAMNLTVVWQMLGIAVILTVVAGAVGILFVMRYEPLKILANRD